MKIKAEPKPIREIMPDGFTMKVVLLRQKGDPGAVSRIVAMEKDTSDYWPFIEQLAMQEDSKAYKARMEFLKQQRQPSKAA